MQNFRNEPTGSIARIITHAANRAKRGKGPSMPFGGEHNPRKALELAKSVASNKFYGYAVSHLADARNYRGNVSGLVRAIGECAKLGRFSLEEIGTSENELTLLYQKYWKRVAREHLANARQNTKDNMLLVSAIYECANLGKFRIEEIDTTRAELEKLRYAA